MADRSVDDLETLDREVARAATAFPAWQARLLTDGDAAFAVDPFDGVRRAAGKSTADALDALSPSVADMPLREGLSKWVRALVLARTGMSDDVAWARAASAPVARFEGDEPRSVGWLEAWRGIASAATSEEGRLWLRSATELGRSLASVQRTRAARRVEVARRLGLSHPWAAFVPEKVGDVKTVAWRLLTRSDDLSRTVWRETLGDSASAAEVLHAALARDCGEGWPARLSPDWIREAFRGQPLGLSLDLGPLPRPSGAASFARALQAFGRAVRTAAVPKWLSFAIGHDPGRQGAHGLGFLFGSLPTRPLFHLKILGISSRAAERQARILARTALLDVRIHAARLVLGDDTSPPTDALFEEITERLFGQPMHSSLNMAWPAPRHDEPARFAALLETRSLADDLQEHYDADWFHNPRAWAHLGEPVVPSAREPSGESALVKAADSTVAGFEDLLG